MLNSIRAVTLVAADLEAVERAYVEALDYRVVDRGRIDRRQAMQWGAPAARDSRQLLLQPASAANTFLRIVERPNTDGYRMLHHPGWNANEILVEDPVALAERFAHSSSPFRIVGPPTPLDSSPAVIAMQAIGPAGEMNYFTRIPPGGGTFIKTAAAAFVDRTFIVVLGGLSITAMQSFYRSLGATVTEAYPAKVLVLQEALSLPPDTVTPTALVTLSPGCLIELDELPARVTRRPTRRDDLPPGFALVSVGIDRLDDVEVEWKVAPQVRDEAPYDGRRVGLLEGAAGEWLELVETG